ncbi:MAG: adenylate/guanylate cyclase domain-containing protein [Spirochaetia bacterium]|jgi:class 3 adenylate cyclase|nr:adenylate/guanylate cyclase domain-containing protein [Spirochaetia bacterium]
MSKKQAEGQSYIFTLETVQRILEKYPNNPGYAAQCLEDIMEYLPAGSISLEDNEAIVKIIEKLRTENPTVSPSAENQEAVLRQEILDYYVPTVLVKAFLASGGIPKDSKITQIGVGFIDIVDYSYLSKFLTPRENQTLLNGLYSCFSEILRRRGGYLNKIEGDAIMFQFGGLSDPNGQKLNPKEEFNNIATQLFLTCVDMQRVCYQFNNADESLFEYLQDTEEEENVRDAFGIIHYMRTDEILARFFNALYQIRIRIGANVGEVSIGNFGPPGWKHWDIIGNPVIEAKRMESTSPIGGLRIAESFYHALEEIGIVDSYYQEFCAAAEKLNGYFREIKKEEVFQYGSVILKDKKNASFPTYSVLVDPGLPEALVKQITLLLEKGEAGADRIVDLVKYYRGNRYVINAIEDVFNSLNIRLRKDKMVHFLFPEKYMRALRIMGGDESKVEAYIEERHRLYDFLKTLGNYQDRLKLSPRKEDPPGFVEYDQYLDVQLHMINDNYRRITKNATHNTYFFNVIFPLIFQSIKASILEYQDNLRKYTQEEEAAKMLAAAETVPGRAGSDEADKGLETLEEVEELEEV